MGSRWRMRGWPLQCILQSSSKQNNDLKWCSLYILYIYYNTCIVRLLSFRFYGIARGRVPTGEKVGRRYRDRMGMWRIFYWNKRVLHSSAFTCIYLFIIRMELTKNRKQRAQYTSSVTRMLNDISNGNCHYINNNCYSA